MSRRVYKKDHQSVIIESTGEPKNPPEDDDIWHVTAVLEEGVEIRSILWTTQVKELVAQLGLKNWIKEVQGEKETT